MKGSRYIITALNADNIANAQRQRYFTFDNRVLHENVFTAAVHE